MMLVIEKVTDDLVSVTHYGEQNGDSMRDPEMLFRIEGDLWLPYSFQNDYTGTYQEVYETGENGQEMFRPKLQSSLTSFAATWAKNIRDQGFLNKERTQAESGSHQWILDGKTAPDSVMDYVPEIATPAPTAEQVRVAEDAHLESAYEDSVAGDYEPSIYDGTYSEE